MWSSSNGRVSGAPDAVPGAQLQCDAERFVRSIKEECLNRVILLGERHFRRTIAEFVTHYHGERNHQGIGNELIQSERRPAKPRLPFDDGSGSEAC